MGEDVVAILKFIGKTAIGTYRGRFQSSGKYLFVAHPNCCPKCSLLGQTPHFFSTPDVAFITHPNCKCATIEAPAGLSPAELMEWAKNPVGTMRFGFNYGVPLKSVNITDRNRAMQLLAFQNRMASENPRTKIRASVTQSQIERIRRQVKEGTLGPAKNFTAGIKRNATIAQNKLMGGYVAPQPLPESSRSSIASSSARGHSRVSRGASSRRRARSSYIPHSRLKSTGRATARMTFSKFHK